jgi:hypothetical protein
MKSRVQFGVLCAAFLAGVLSGASLYAQTAAQQRRAARQQRREERLAERPAHPNAPAKKGAALEGPAANAGNLPAKAMERLQDLPPDKQERFLQNNQRFQTLPPEQQAKIRENLQAWNRLTPVQQQDLRDRQRVWEQMTPEQRTYVRQTVLPHWQQLPPVRRQAILQRLHSLRDLSEADRQSRLNDPAFTQGMSGEDRDMLQQLAHLHVGMAPDGPGL